MAASRALAGATLAGFLLAGCGGGADEVCDTPSKLPVPRFVSLKSGEVNARNGPGEDHRILWVWRVKGLPLKVIAETREWRRVEDPDGGKAWVKLQMVDGRRTVIRKTAGDLALLAEPKPGARVTAYLRAGAVATQTRNEKGWSRLKVGGASGWAPEGEVWGAGPEPVCTPRPR
jgi:SH3-like domain-containing protein